jgi:hypothetical protein
VFLFSLAFNRQIQAEEISLLNVGLSGAVGQSQPFENHSEFHRISIGADGSLEGKDNTRESVREAFFKNFLKLKPAADGKRRILFFAHGGLVKKDWALSDQESCSPALIEHGIYPVSFVWPTDLIEDILPHSEGKILNNLIKNIASPELNLEQRIYKPALENYGKLLPSGSEILRFMKADPSISKEEAMMLAKNALVEDAGYYCGGRDVWSAMKEKAFNATVSKDGGARYVAGLLAELSKREDFEIHLTGHSAGSIFMAPFAQYLTTDGIIPSGPLKGLTGLGIKVKTVTLRAPACTIETFKAYYLPSFESGQIEHIAIFNLDAESELADDCMGFYDNSILHLVRGGLNTPRRLPILGLDECIKSDGELSGLINSDSFEYIECPNTLEIGHRRASRADKHFYFSEGKDEVNFMALIAQVLGVESIDINEGHSNADVE